MMWILLGGVAVMRDVRCMATPLTHGVRRGAADRLRGLRIRMGRVREKAGHPGSCIRKSNSTCEPPFSTACSTQRKPGQEESGGAPHGKVDLQQGGFYDNLVR